MFDDDDDDNANNDPGFSGDQNLVGTWYRYSLSDDGISNDFIPSKLEIEENGSGIEFTFLLIDIGGFTQDLLYAVENDFTWDTDGDVLTFLEKNTDSTLVEGDYVIGSGTDFLTITNDSGMKDFYVRKMEVLDQNLVDLWWLDTLMVEGGTGYDFDRLAALDIRENGIVPSYLSPDYSWSVNGSYLLLENMENPNFDYSLHTYYYTEALDTLILTSYGREDLMLGWSPVKRTAIYTKIYIN